MKDINVFELIEITGVHYKLRSVVRCNNNHFTCAVESHSKWTYFDDLCFTVKEFANFSSLRQVYKEGWFFTIYELGEMEIQYEQDEIFNCTPDTSGNYNTYMKMKRNARAKIACEPGAREILDNSLMVDLENTNDAKISNTPSFSGPKVVHNQRKKENTRKNVNFTRNRKRKIPQKEATANIAKRRKNSDESVQPSENSSLYFCEFQTNEDNNFTLQSPIADNVHDKDDKPLMNEIDFKNPTTYNEELHQQTSSKENMRRFHKALKFTIYQCHVCHEAWPLKTKPKNSANYICSRGVHDKSVPKKFSADNSMIPSPVPKELQGLTQFEEMLIARAFPVMHVYTKLRGGQRAYKGHVLTLPQDVQKLAEILPRCPKDLPVIIFTVNCKDNSFSSDFVVRRKKVEDALYCLTGKSANGETNNPLYKNVKIDRETLSNLPENDILSDVIRVEGEEKSDDNEDT